MELGCPGLIIEGADPTPIPAFGGIDAPCPETIVGGRVAFAGLVGTDSPAGRCVAGDSGGIDTAVCNMS